MSASETMNVAPGKLAFSIPEACEAASVGRSTLYAEAKAGRLRVTKIRGRSVVRAEDLHAWLARAAEAGGRAA